eukprot:4316772-Pyramimonas_sp.AAC.1
MNGWPRPVVRAQREAWRNALSSRLPAERKNWSETYFAGISQSYMVKFQTAGDAKSFREFIGTFSPTWIDPRDRRE